jgi:cyclopropane fatty-acyl-phospholipid synthase-like methyltransferase
MAENRSEIADMLDLKQYPRSAKYDPSWMMENVMGPNVLWLTEALSKHMEFKPGMRVLDMGCGKAISSIFLAKEFNLQVWANDLWIPASENWQRICAAGVEERVFPIHAEAQQLPYAENFFDAAISMDAYHYFGTNDLYFRHYYAPLVKPGGQIGIIVPGLRKPLENGVPDELKPYWDWEFCSFHTPEWWKRHWENSEMVEIETAGFLEDGWKDWLIWEMACQKAGYPYSPEEIELLNRDAGNYLGFTILVARRKK